MVSLKMESDVSEVYLLLQKLCFRSKFFDQVVILKNWCPQK